MKLKPKLFRKKKNGGGNSLKVAGGKQVVTLPGDYGDATDEGSASTPSDEPAYVKIPPVVVQAKDPTNMSPEQKQSMFMNKLKGISQEHVEEIPPWARNKNVAKQVKVFSSDVSNDTGKTTEMQVSGLAGAMESLRLGELTCGTGSCTGPTMFSAAEPSPNTEQLTVSSVRSTDNTLDETKSRFLESPKRIALCTVPDESMLGDGFGTYSMPESQSRLGYTFTEDTSVRNDDNDILSKEGEQKMFENEQSILSALPTVACNSPPDFNVNEQPKSQSRQLPSGRGLRTVAEHMKETKLRIDPQGYDKPIETQLQSSDHRTPRMRESPSTVQVQVPAYDQGHELSGNKKRKGILSRFSVANSGIGVSRAKSPLIDRAEPSSTKGDFPTTDSMMGSAKAFLSALSLRTSDLINEERSTKSAEMIFNQLNRVACHQPSGGTEPEGNSAGRPDGASFISTQGNENSALARGSNSAWQEYSSLQEKEANPATIPRVEPELSTLQSEAVDPRTASNSHGSGEEESPERSSPFSNRVLGESPVVSGPFIVGNEKTYVVEDSSAAMGSLGHSGENALNAATDMRRAVVSAAGPSLATTQGRNNVTDESAKANENPCGACMTQSLLDSAANATSNVPDLFSAFTTQNMIDQDAANFAAQASPDAVKVAPSVARYMAEKQDHNEMKLEGFDTKAEDLLDNAHPIHAKVPERENVLLASLTDEQRVFMGLRPLNQFSPEAHPISNQDFHDPFTNLPDVVYGADDASTLSTKLDLFPNEKVNFVQGNPDNTKTM